MKKLSLFFALIMSLTLLMTACNDNNKPDGNTDANVNTEVTEEAKLPEINAEEFKKAPHRYIYNNMTEEEQYLYRTIYAAVSNFEQEVVFDKEYDGVKAVNVYEAVFFQEPEIFWFRGEVKDNSKPMSRMSLAYWCSKEEMPAYQKQIDEATAKIMANVPSDGNDFDKLLAVHDQIAKFAEFQKNTDFNTSTIYGPLVAGPTQCEAFAKVTTYFANKMNIPSVRVTGFDKNGFTHAWNKVQIEDKWYNFDLTWDDPKGNTNPEYFTHNYFFVSDKDINEISHFPEMTYAAPVADSSDMNYFTVKGLVAKSKDEAISMLEAQMKEAVKTKAPAVQIRCETKEVYDEVIDAMITKLGVLDIVEKANAESENKIKSPSNASDERLNIVNIKFKYE